MKNIVLTRIDDRLIHGQVMTAWVQYTKGNKIEIIDEEIANDSFLKMVTTSTAPEGIEVRVDNVNDAVNYLKGENNGENVMILVKSPQVIYSLIKNNIEIKDLNVGGMGANKNRKKLFRNIAVSNDERVCFREILNKGVNINVQVIPSDKKEDITKYL